MAAQFTSLTIHRLVDTLDEKPIRNLAGFIDSDKKTTRYRLKRGFNFGALLFIGVPDRGLPAWVEPLQAGFGPLRVQSSISNSAVLIMRVKNHGKNLHFALTFGSGRFLLRPEALRDKYGFRVALNVIYPKGTRKKDAKPIRSVGSKTIAANVLRTQRQADQKTDFEAFQIDTQSDLLGGVTGTPFDTDNWGTRIDGSDALHFLNNIEFSELGGLCLEVEKESGKLPRNFSWVDNIRPVRNPATIVKLKNEALKRITTLKTEGLDLSPPELIDWAQLTKFSFSFSRRSTFSEPSLQEYIERLYRGNNGLPLLSLSQLLRHRLLAFDAAKNPLKKGTIPDREWPIYKCLTGEIRLGEKTYILSDGDFFEVAKSYMAQLNSYIRSLDELKSLAPSRKGWSEDRYNKTAAVGSNGNALLLDKQTVKLDSRTTPIEICDILTIDKKLIHVKRKLNSSSLSHLFAQGLVSADLLLMNDEFRSKAHQRIKAVEKKRHAGNGFSSLFPPDDVIKPRDFMVVYGIIADWNGRALDKALPFFSKVNLRRYVQDLRRMGYQVSYQRIDIDKARKKSHSRIALVPPKRPVQSAEQARRIATLRRLASST
jgi:uncharacterized protein (TIGR04141 family)